MSSCPVTAPAESHVACIHVEMEASMALQKQAVSETPFGHRSMVHCVTHGVIVWAATKLARMATKSSRRESMVRGRSRKVAPQRI